MKTVINKRFVKNTVLTGIALAVGVILILVVIVFSVLQHAPAGPAQAKGWEGKYYNLVYALTPCPDLPLEKYEDGNLSAFHYTFGDLPGVENSSGDLGDSRVNVLESCLKYKQQPAIFAGRTLIDRYRPHGKQAGGTELKDCSAQYAVEHLGQEIKAQYGVISGSGFSAQYNASSREMICFTDKKGMLYCFEDPDMAMQRGKLPFGPNFRYSLGLGAAAIGDHTASGLSGWLRRPRSEKSGECNYFMLKRTLRLKGE